MSAGLQLLVFAGVLMLTMACSAPAVELGVSNSAHVVFYSGGGLDPSHSEGLVATELPSGRVLGRVDIGGTTQGGGFRLSADARRAYLLDREWLADRGLAEWRLTELEAPSLVVLRRTPVPDAISLLGFHRVVAVGVDGKQVYVETWRATGPPRFDPVLRVGQSDGDYGLAVYDVGQGVLVGEIRLEPPWCGVAELYALPDGQLSVFCPTAQEVRLVDPRRRQQVAAIGLGNPPHAGNRPGWAITGIPSPDGHRFWMVRDTGELLEIDLQRQAVSRAGDLGGDGGQWVPVQHVYLTADGKRLFVRAAPQHAELRATGNGSVVWVADTDTLERVGEIPLPAPAFELIPTPDGRAVIATTNNVPVRSEFGTRMLEVPTGRELAFWQAVAGGFDVVESTR